MDLKFKSIAERLSQKSDIPIDIAKGLPRIEISGLEEIVIENYKGILGFDNNHVEVNSSVGKINISGSNLEILYMGTSTIIVGGSFKSIEYKGGKE